MNRGVLKPLSYGPFVFLLCFAVQTAAVLILAPFCEENRPGMALLLTFYTQAAACTTPDGTASSPPAAISGSWCFSFSSSRP